MFDVITVGSNVVDVFVKTESDLIEIKNKSGTEELIAYPLGSKILIQDLQFLIGGGGTNTAVSFARQGFKTGYLGKIGKDENGLKIFKLLKEEKIDFIGTLGDMSGYSVILDSMEDDRTILSYRGCNSELTFSEINKRKLASKWFYICSMTGESFETIVKISEFAKKIGAKVAFNATSYLTEKGFSYLERILKNTDIFIVNTEEATDLVGKGKIEDLMKRLKLDSMQMVVITDGKNGSYCYDGTKLYSTKPNKIKVKETTGAGDSFGSTFVGGIIRGKQIPQALKMASINAESVIQNYGAKNILLKKSTLERKLRVDKRKVSSKKL